MAKAPLHDELTYYGLDKPTLPYRTNTSAVDETAHWVTGSSNTFASIKGDVEKRSGFATPIETILSAVPGTIVRIFRWRRFSGSFFVMLSVTTGTANALSQVWKLEVGVDESFVQIYTDVTSTTASPFDFVTSNNFCFFGNQTTRKNMRKFDGSKVSLWGIDSPAASPSASLITASLPPGLTFSGGTLSGTPSMSGNYTVVFTATDSSGDTTSQSFPIIITTGALDWTYPTGQLPYGQLNIAYSSTGTEVRGGSAPYTYSLSSGSFPPGIFINPAGDLSGTPTMDGYYEFGLTATDSKAATATREFSLFIGDTSISISPPSPLTGTTGTPYSSAIIAGGGTAPYTYGLVSGTAPPGISLGLDGTVIGTPTESGVYPLTFQVTDSLQVTNQLSVSYTINSSSLNISTQPPAPAGKVGFAYSFTPMITSVSSQSGVSSTQAATGDWELVGNQYRTHYEPATTALSDLVFSGFGFTVPTGAAIVGVTASVYLISQSNSTGTVSQVSLYHSSALGVAKMPGTPFTTTNTPQSYGSSNDLWGSASMLTPATINDVGFGFAIAVNVPDRTRVFIGMPYGMTVYYTSTQYTVTAQAGAITAQTGYIYGQTFTSIYSHESSMSMLSPSTGVFTNMGVRTNVIASSDPQVNGINLYRTTDGGDADPSVMRLLDSLPNMDATYIDSTPDIYLGSQTGPALYVNNPPQPLDGLVWSNGRIWGRNGSKTWYTGNEEVTNGVPEECMSDALNGNFYAWPSQVGGMAVTSNGVDIGLSEQFWQISGDTLSTFRKSPLLTGGGTKSPINIIAVGDTVMWIDTAKQIYSSQDGEFGLAIRPDLSSIILAQAFIRFHKSKLYNWIVVLDAQNSILYVYDVDLSQWNTPWQLAGQATAICSGEVNDGNIQLLVAFASGHVMSLTPGMFVDDGIQYGETLKSNLIPLIPRRSTTARNPSEVRQVAQFDMEVSIFQPEIVLANTLTAQVHTTPIQSATVGPLPNIPRYPDYFGGLIDDDPAQSTQDNYCDFSSNRCDPQYQDQTIQKRYISPQRWPVDQAFPMGRRVAFYAQWQDSPEPWIMYSVDVAWRT